MKKKLLALLAALLIGSTVAVGATACEIDYDPSSGIVSSPDDGTSDITNPVETDDFLYEVNGDGKSCTIRSIDRPDATELVIPEKIDGYTVTTLGNFLFEKCPKLTHVSLPDTLTEIGFYTFYECDRFQFSHYKNGKYLGSEKNPYMFFYGTTATDFSSFELHNNTRFIHSAAFANCGNLTDIVLPDGLISIGISAFSGCDRLKNIQIPNSVTDIGDQAFYGCAQLQYLSYKGGNYLGNEDNPYLALVDITSSDFSFHKDTKIISLYSWFEGATSIEIIEIPDGVTGISMQAFVCFRGLKEIKVSANNANYRSIDGNLYSKDGTQLIAYAAGKEETSFEIPDGVRSIKGGSFYTCENLTEVKLPDSIVSVESGAFSNCALTSIEIPENVISVEAGAFVGGYLQEINVSEKNCMYRSIDGNLYSKDGKMLVQYASSKTESTFVIPETVTRIGIYSFSACTNLTSIEIPDSVTSIGALAFVVCFRLTSIEIPNGVTSIGGQAFAGCQLLTSIVIPDSVTSIGDQAFRDCSSLTSITVSSGNKVYHSAGNCLIKTADKTLVVGCENSVIPTDGSVTSIGGWAFSGCSSLTSIVIPDSVTSIGALAFANCYSLTSVEIPNGVTSIGDGAFLFCYSLTSVYYNGTEAEWNEIEIGLKNEDLTSAERYYSGEMSNSPLKYAVNDDGESCTITGIGTFTGKNLVIPEKIDGYTVMSIGDSAFYCCGDLTSVDMPDSVTSIGENAFLGCNKLTSVRIGNGVTSIGAYAFISCDSLTSITVLSGNKVYRSAGNCIIKTADKTLVVGCNNSIIPTDGSVTSIGDSAFSGRGGLTSVTIGNGVKSIGVGAFSGCYNLTSVTISNGVKSIGDEAFFFCDLTSVTIGDSVESIGDSAFGSCSSLTSIMVSSGNRVYHSAGNCLIKTADKTLVVGCKNSVIPADGSVTSIGSLAFMYCDSLTSVIIGNGVTSIGDYAFAYCRSLTSITVSNGNKVYHSAGNCIIETADKKLVVGCNNSVIPADGSVTSIGCQAFEGCRILTSIVIPDTITSIVTFAFLNCWNLTSIAFNGTKEQWNAIEKNNEWNDASAIEVIHCTDGDIIL